MARLARLETQRVADPRAFEISIQLRNAPTENAIDWLAENRTTALDFSKPEAVKPDLAAWDPIIDKVLYLRRVPELDHALCRYGIHQPIVEKLQAKGGFAHKVSAAANPFAGEGIWRQLLDRRKPEFTRAILSNPGLSVGAMLRFLTLPPADNEELARRLIYLSLNPRWVWLASGCLSPETANGVPFDGEWSRLKSYLAELVQKRRTSAPLAVAFGELFKEYRGQEISRGLVNILPVKSRERIAALDRWCELGDNPKMQTKVSFEGFHTDLRTVRSRIANALVFPDEVTILDDDPDVLAAFCRCVNPDGSLREAIQSKEFSDRVREYQRQNLGCSPENPFLENLLCWKTTVGRRLIERHQYYARAFVFERMKQRLANEHPEWFTGDYSGWLEAEEMFMGTIRDLKREIADIKQQHEREKRAVGTRWQLATAVVVVISVLFGVLFH